MKITAIQNIKKFTVTANQTTKQVRVTVNSSIKKETVITVSQLGKRGFRGKSNYEIAVDSGFTGTELEWIDSQKNVDGGLIF